jgi:hypothetical protein
LEIAWITENLLEKNIATAGMLPGMTLCFISAVRSTRPQWIEWATRLRNVMFNAMSFQAEQRFTVQGRETSPRL